MGFMDGLTSDGTVDMKHTEYYNLMKESGKSGIVEQCGKSGSAGLLYPGNDYRRKAGIS